MTLLSRSGPSLRRVYRSIGRRSCALAAHTLVVLGSVLGAPALSAQVPVPVVQPQVDLLRLPQRDHVLHDELEGGELWAKGATYKAGFATHGAQYVPFLGASAPRNFPVRFRIASATLGGEPIALDDAAAPRRDGDVVRYERGGLVEIYELSLRSLEQKFAFSSLPEGGSGDLVVRLSTESELTPREAADGFEFGNDLGGVRYGRATALDASGASVAAPTVLTGSGIEIRVPAAFVASARLPLVIDPIVSSFFFESSSDQTLNPDVAYDASTNRWLVVWEEAFSASDHDVHYYITNPFSPFPATGIIDASGTYYARPACANHAGEDQFLVVAEFGLPSSGSQQIRGRTLTIRMPTVTIGTIFSITPFIGNHYLPDVGGDPSGSSPSYYAVVYERVQSSDEHNIEARLVTTAGTLVGTTPIPIDVSTGTEDGHPSISKSNGGDKWNIVWEREVGTTATDYDVRGARLSAQGSLVASSFSIHSDSLSDSTRPSPSSCLTGTDKWMVAFEYWGTTGGQQVRLLAFDDTTQVDADWPQLMWLGAYPDGTSFNPEVESDGTTFLLTWAIDPTGTPASDVYAGTVALAGNEIVRAQEPLLVLAGTTTPEDKPAVAAAHGSGGDWLRYLAVCEVGWDILGTYGDMEQFAQFCFPFDTYTGSCPCSNPPVLSRGCNNSANTGGATLSGIGLASLSNDTLHLRGTELKPSSLVIFNQGTLVLPTAVAFGQGLRCVGGVTKRLYTRTSSATGFSEVPGTGESSVHDRSSQLGDVITAGTTRYYYAYYRDGVVQGGCPATATYNTSTSLQVTWLP